MVAFSFKRSATALCFDVFDTIHSSVNTQWICVAGEGDRPKNFGTARNKARSIQIEECRFASIAASGDVNRSCTSEYAGHCRETVE
jgi:hypothetical protein